MKNNAAVRIDAIEPKRQKVVASEGMGESHERENKIEDMKPSVTIAAV